MAVERSHFEEERRMHYCLCHVMEPERRGTEFSESPEIGKTYFDKPRLMACGSGRHAIIYSGDIGYRIIWMFRFLICSSRSYKFAHILIRR